MSRLGEGNFSAVDVSLYGQLLAAVHLNWEINGKEVQEVFECYTIGDVWKFVRAEVSGITSDRPLLRTE